MSKLSVVLLAAMAFAACSSGSPTGPSADGLASAARGGAPAASGLYDLQFRSQYPDGDWKDVDTLPVSAAELLIRVHVTDSTGQPATSGSVTIEYCSYGGQKNNIDRPDEAPAAACATGTARWVRHTSRSVTAGGCPEFATPELATGYVCANFGVVQIPRSVGFRAVYQSRSGGIAAGTTLPEDFTWY